jgi:hypothetical protein
MKQRVLIWLAILGLLGFVVVRLTAGNLATTVGPGDFVEYWAGGRLILEGGNPYDAHSLLPLERSAGWNREEALVPFQPPWSMLYVLPFALMPFWVGRFAWLMLNLGLVVWSADRIWRLYRGKPTQRMFGWFLAPLFMPAAISLSLGQISPFVLAGIVGFVVALAHGHGKTAGSATMLIAVKPHVVPAFWLVLALWILKNRRWDVALGAIVSFCVLVIIALAINPSIYRHYLDVFGGQTGPTMWETPTLNVALQRLFPAAAWVFVLPTLIGFAVGIALWMRWRESFDFTRHLPAILLISAITTPYAWTFDWIILLPVGLLVVMRYLQGTKINLAFVVCLAVFQVVLAIQGYLHVSNFYTIWFSPALAVLFWLGARRLPTISFG